MRHTLAIPALLALLVACSTPYNAPVVVRGSPPFPGLASMIAQDPVRGVDVIMVHGMCTHDTAWAHRNMDRIVNSIDASYVPKPSTTTAAEENQIQIVERSDQVGGGMVRFHAVVWSPLVGQLKQQLAYDSTGSPTDCAKDAECKPKRAQFNGQLKEKMLNDCLSDAMIYQGQGHRQIKKAIVETVAKLLQETERRADNQPGPLVMVAESMGSKILFDALSDMMQPEAPEQLHALAQRAAQRLAIVFMISNQLPILGLAEQQIDQAVPGQEPGGLRADALERFLTLRRAQSRAPQNKAATRLAIVAFTDPNDLLSYRLQPSRYSAVDVVVADVLVSNSRTWISMFENPFAAHMDYLKNEDVGAIVACGWPRSAACR
jgi:hypothetical protein